MFFEVTLKLLEGFGTNCLIFLGTLVLALPLGLIISFGSMSRFAVVRKPVRVFIWIIRGIPLMLFLIIVFYGPALVFGIPVADRLVAAMIAFVINYACYFAEIFRGGIESIPKGQYEAGQVLGLTKRQIFFKIVLFQVIKRILAPMGNEVITLIKDTSLVRIIIIEEIVKFAYDFATKGLIWPVFYTGVFYLVSVGLLTILFGKLEKKMSFYKE
ncbi:MAG: amino acid ABC transporter permease [Clostridia bacterium]|nr:amino acid ABC transporter permease [Clostridia bacterium]